MCFRRRKPKKIINSKYQIGDVVVFRKRGELMFGWIYLIYEAKDESILYDIQIGGQCTAIIYGFKEADIIGLKDEVMKR